MALILLIETSSRNCSVGIQRDGQLLGVIEQSADSYIHAESLHPFIEKILSDTNISAKDIEAIAVSEGPGSYTGLRIGVASAKGLCLALDIPLIALSTTAILANFASSHPDCPEHIIPMIDARRMEVYCAHFLRGGEKIISDEAKIIDEDFFKPLENKSVLFIGDGAEKCRAFISKYHRIEHALPGASMMVSLAEIKFNASAFEDIAYFEPHYLKDYLPGISTKSIL